MSSNASDPTWPAFPILAFVSLVLVLTPLPWHLGAKNIGTTMFILWSSVSVLTLFINSIVWHKNAFNVAPVWCDISSRVIVGATVGIPASVLCIARKLRNIASTRTMIATTTKERKRHLIIDLCISFLFPLICIALEYIVQGQRFSIFGGFGCRSATYNSIPAIFLSYQWPLSISLASLCYCFMTIRTLSTSRSRFYQVLETERTLTISQFYRLLGFAVFEALFIIIIASLNINANIRNGLLPWNSWTWVHEFWSFVELWPYLLWDGRFHWIKMGLELCRWSTICHGYIFFFYIGCAGDVWKGYQSLFRSLATKVGFRFEGDIPDGCGREGDKQRESDGFAMQRKPSKTWSTRGLFKTTGIDAESVVDGERPKGSHDPFESTISVPALGHTYPPRLDAVVTTELDHRMEQNSKGGIKP